MLPVHLLKINFFLFLFFFFLSSPHFLPSFFFSFVVVVLFFNSFANATERALLNLGKNK